ncbi:MAG TPA: helix-turn-helix domain-containing protein [Geminicoccus sp.]|jgi:hypothetical protein|uniref:helix-turn-helix domain-containing protein n=1 Tax=Geminicoccus sp. TaxID=2024832 RepID=UPI002E36E6C7|nr:helix-turn-helix domain-containing protein [Geminicoccus sp.]HEX2527103.1 helix-turn-helix domain-containing protein [Geminicoccus sp.]
MAGVAAARHWGRPPTLSQEQVEQVTSALNNGASKASICWSFKVPRSTLLDTLGGGVGWTMVAGI